MTCSTSEGLRERSDKITVSLIKQGRVGFDAQLAYFFEKNAIPQLTAIADYIKDSYKGLRNADLSVQERNGLWTDKAVDELDIPTYLNQLSNGAERRNKIAEYNKKRQEELSSDNVESAPIFNGTTLAEGPNTKPALRYAFADEIPEYGSYITSEQYPFLDQHQVFGVNGILTAYNEGKPAFFLADKQGVGKSAQILIAANEIKLKTPSRGVLIVTENTQIINSQLMGDIKKINAANPLTPINPYNITFTTYSSLSKYSSGDWAAVFLDESQNVANHNQAHKTVAAMKPGMFVFASGTPFETPLQSTLFIAKMEGKTEEQVGEEMGFAVMTEQDASGKDRVSMYIEDGLDDFTFYKQYRDAIENKVRKFVKEGQMLKRQYPFWGTVQEVNITNAIPATLMMRITNINEYFKQKMRSYKKMLQHKGWSEADPRHQKTLQDYGKKRLINTTKATEIAKEGFIWQDMKSHLANGYNVVIATQYVGEDSDGYKLDIEGTNGVQGAKVRDAAGNAKRDIIILPTLLQQLKTKLQKEKVPFVELHGQVKEAERTQALAQFQSNNARVMLMTMESGSTGIDLDDQSGTAPRVMYVVTKGFSEKTLQQLLYRISRRNSKSPGSVVMVNINDSLSDQRSNAILDRKRSILEAIMDESPNDINVAAVYSLSTKFHTEREMLVAKGIDTEQKLYEDYKKFQRNLPEASIDEYIAELNKC